MFTVSYFPSVSHRHPDVYLYHYHSGKVRLHKRGRYHRIDTWFNSFNEVIHIIDKMITSGHWNNFKLSDGDMTPFEYEQSQILNQRQLDNVAP